MAWKAWVDFAICFFLGLYGVHKFKEKKIGMGILYLFTAGLFGFGWLYDCIKYLVVAVKSIKGSQERTYHSENTSIHFSTPELMAEHSKIIAIFKEVGLWLVTGFFALMALVYLPGIAGFIAAAVALFTAPIPKWQGLVDKYVTRKVKTAAVIVLAILAFVAIPAPETTNDGVIPMETTMMAASESTESAPEIETNEDATSAPNEDSATEAETEIPTEAPTEAATAPVAETTQPTTPPATQPTVGTETEPTTAPTTAPATESTTPPATQPTVPAPTEAPSQSGDNSSSDSDNTNISSGVLVWIPQTGKRYHSYAGCSNMVNPTQVTKEQAENMGYTPCKKCW